METKTKAKVGTFTSQATRLFTHQIITTEDLIVFKQELLIEFEKLFKSYSTQTQKRWLKAHQVRRLLNISIGTLQTLKSSGVIPYKSWWCSFLRL